MSLLLLFKPPPLVPTLVGSFGANAGATQTMGATATLPTGIQDGDVGFLQISVNGGPTSVDPTIPNGWTLEAILQNAANNLRSWLYKRASLTAAESGTTVTFTFAVGFRWNITGVVMHGADPSLYVGGDWSDTTDDLTMTIPALTPPAANTLFIALGGFRYAGTTPLGVTPGATWTELQDIATTNATVPTIGAWAGMKTVTGNDGTPVAAEDQAFASNARGNGWVLSFPYAVVTPPTTVVPDLASSTAAALAPTVTTTVTVVPDLASSTAVAFAPTVSTTTPATTVTPDLASSTAQAFAPTVSTSVTASPGLASSTATALAPAVSTTVTVTPGVATSTPAALAPSVTTTVTASPGIASSTPQAFAPSVSTTVTATPGLATSTPTAFAPAVTPLVTVTPDLASSTATAFAPVITVQGGPTTVVPGVATSTPTAYAPTVTTTVTITPGVAAGSPQAYGPVVTVGPPPTARPPLTRPITALFVSDGGGNASFTVSGMGTAVFVSAGGSAAFVESGAGTATFTDDGTGSAAFDQDGAGDAEYLTEIGVASFV